MALMAKAGPVPGQETGASSESPTLRPSSSAFLDHPKGGGSEVERPGLNLYPYGMPAAQVVGEPNVPQCWTQRYSYIFNCINFLQM